MVNNEGVPIKSTLDNPTTVQYSGLLNNLVDQVNSVTKIYNDNAIQTKINSYIVLPNSYYGKTHKQFQLSKNSLKCILLYFIIKKIIYLSDVVQCGSELKSTH